MLSCPYEPRQCELLDYIQRTAGPRYVMAQAIALAETRAGKDGPVGDLDKPVGQRSYCELQVRVPAAKDVLARWPEVWPKYKPSMADEVIVARLLTNRWFCVQAGARYYELMLQRFPDKATAVTAYNTGPDRVRKKLVDPKTHPYTVRVLGFEAQLVGAERASNERTAESGE